MPVITDISKINTKKYYFDNRAAESAVRYIETHIRHVKGELAGHPLKLEEWQKKQIIEPLFGWKHIETGLRKFTSAYVEIPKKSGKSFLAASIAAIFLDIEPEGGSEIVGVAWGRKQAGLVFEATKEVIKKSPRLKSKCKIYRNSITAPDHLGGTKTYQILSKEAGGEDGINPQLAIIDELHVHKNNEVLEMVEKSQGARLQPLSFVITTAGSDLYGIGFERHEYAINVAKGIITDESMLVCVYGADPNDDPYDEQTWIKANPNYNISIGKRAYEKEAAKARVSAASLNSFKRYYLNIWTASQDGWINDDVFVKSSSYENEVSLGQISQIDFKGCNAYAGLDLSSRSDITAFSLIIPKNGIYYSLNWFFLPEDKGSKSADEGSIKYREWVKNGYIIETPGNVVDYEYIVNYLYDICKQYNVIQMAYDPYNSNHVIPKMIEQGIKTEFMEFRQGFISMNAPTKEIQAAIESGKLEHFNNPVLRWMVSNSEVVYDQRDNIKIVKDPRHREKKIDGVISNIMAYGLSMQEPKSKGSYLLTDDLFII